MEGGIHSPAHAQPALSHSPHSASQTRQILSGRCTSGSSPRACRPPVSRSAACSLLILRAPVASPSLLLARCPPTEATTGPLGAFPVFAFPSAFASHTQYTPLLSPHHTLHSGPLPPSPRLSFPSFTLPLHPHAHDFVLLSIFLSFATVAPPFRTSILLLRVLCRCCCRRLRNLALLVHVARFPQHYPRPRPISHTTTRLRIAPLTLPKSSGSRLPPPALIRAPSAASCCPRSPEPQFIDLASSLPSLSLVLDCFLAGNCVCCLLPGALLRVSHRILFALYPLSRVCLSLVILCRCDSSGRDRRGCG